MKVACVTPYHREASNVLAACLDSVQRQKARCHHYLVADGYPQDWIDDRSGVVHLKLANAHRDYGNAARGLGAMLAVADGADAVTFLDADNTYDDEHVALCLETARRAGMPDFVIAKRRFVSLDGKIMEVPEEPDHVDTNCLFILPGAFHVLPYWVLQPRALAKLGDRLFFGILRRQGLRSASVPRPTVNYVSNWRVHYEAAGLTPPLGAKGMITTDEIARWWGSLTNREREIMTRRTGIPIRLRS